MAIVLPDVIIFNTIEGILKKIKNNWENNADKTKTILYKLFNGASLGAKYDLYEQAQEIFLRGENNNNKIKVRVGYDRERAQLPTIYINLPGEQGGSGDDSLGVGLGADTKFDDDNNTYTEVYRRGFKTNYAIVIMSPNRNEVVLIYNTLKALLIPLIEQLEATGLKNIVISGREISLTDEIVPQHLYMRAVGLDFVYHQDVESLDDNTFPNELNLQGTIKIEDNE